LFVILFLGAIALYVVSVYNALQTAKTQIVAAIQEIGNQLKRQANLIPNLQEAVKAYLKQEKTIFSMLTDARKLTDQAVKDKSLDSAEKAASKIQALLPKIQVLVESNPQLKSNETIGQFMEELRDTADKLMYSRRGVIDIVQDYNAKLVTFPSNLVANAFGFKPEKGLETPLIGSHLKVTEHEMEDVKVSL